MQESVSLKKQLTYNYSSSHSLIILNMPEYHQRLHKKLHPFATTFSTIILTPNSTKFTTKTTTFLKLSHYKIGLELYIFNKNLLSSVLYLVPPLSIMVQYQLGVVGIPTLLGFGATQCH